MVKGSGVVYQSKKAADEMWSAMLLVGETDFRGEIYINEETASANLQLAILKREAYGPFFQ